MRRRVRFSGLKQPPHRGPHMFVPASGVSRARPPGESFRLGQLFPRVSADATVVTAEETLQVSSSASTIRRTATRSAPT